MGHSLSAAKRERQNAKRRALNRTNRSALKKDLKLFDKTVRENPAERGKAWNQVQAALDRAVRKGAIPKARANRKKARLALLIERLKSQPAPPPSEPAATETAAT